MIERICIILLVNLLFFFKTLGYKYSSDDIPAFQNPPKWNSEIQKRLFQLEGRARIAPQQDHFLTMIIHALVCVFIYTGFGASDVSFLAAFLFAFNPANNQGSVWISGRSYALSALGMTIALSVPVIGPLVLLGATYFNAGFVAPIAFLGSDYAWICLFLPILWGIHFKRFKRNVMGKVKMELFAEDRAIKPQKIVLAVKTFGFYFVHALIPIKNTFYHSFLQSAAGAFKEKAYTMKDRFFWIGLASLGGVGWYIITHWGTLPAFGLFWWCVCIAPFLNFVRIHQEIAERYMYLPNVGLMVALAYIISGHPIVMASVLSIYATKMWFYMDAFQDDYYLVEQACLNSPDAWFSWHVRGLKRWDSGAYKEAVILWTMARMISPNEFKINFNIATALITSKNVKEAFKFLEIAEKNIPAGQEAEVQPLIDKFRKGECSILI